MDGFGADLVDGGAAAGFDPFEEFGAGEVEAAAAFHAGDGALVDVAVDGGDGDGEEFGGLGDGEEVFPDGIGCLGVQLGKGPADLGEDEVLEVAEGQRGKDDVVHG